MTSYKETRQFLRNQVSNFVYGQAKLITFLNYSL